LPFRTITGPPPSASVTPLAGQSGERISRRTTFVGGGASVCSLAACEPCATSTAPSRGIGVPPPVVCTVTVPLKSCPGTADGNGRITASTAPASFGVAGPQAGVNSEVPSPRGGWFSPVNGRRCPRPCQ
jgi:hypothetical protein